MKSSRNRLIIQRAEESVLSSPLPSLPESLPGCSLVGTGSTTGEHLVLVKSNMEGLYNEAGGEWKRDDGKKVSELKASRFLSITADGDNSLVGFISFQFCVEAKVPVVYIYELQVSPEWQGKRVGQFLLDSLMKLCRERTAINHVFLTCLTRNGGALRFYDRAGFRSHPASPREAPYRILYRLVN
jgi:ribosomal protein S18 acetylase RimI-like enzyme